MIYEAIKEVYPNAVTIYGGETAFDKDGIEIVLDESKLAIAVARLQAEYDAQEYARNRVLAYPSVGDQLDMLMKDMKNGTKTHQEACEAVKTKYPKG